MDILVEDLDGSLWVAAIDSKNQLQNLEIDPYTEVIRHGSIYTGKVTRIDTGQNAAFVDLGHGFEGILYAQDVLMDDKAGKTIGQMLRPGQMVLVQVKTPHNPDGSQEGAKHSKLTMDIVIAGRYLIYTPFALENRISKRITDKKMRKQMRGMLADFEDIQGCILRAAAANCQTDMLVREGKILRAIWESLQEFLDEKDPTLLMMGPDALQRTLSDLSGQQVDTISVATMDIFSEAEEWCDLFAPDLMTKIDPRGADNTRSGMGLFEIHDLIGQFEDLLKPYVILPSLGSIIMEQTAAMTVVDVNSGADKDILNTNIEAAQALARQLRIRNLGGLIMVDFIRMKGKAKQDKLIAALETALADDPCTVTFHGVTATGVFELTRQRRTPTLEEKLVMFENDDEI